MTRQPAPAPRSTLLFDGDCGFCTTAAGWIPRLGLHAGTVTAYQHADLPALGVTPEQCQQALQWVDAHGVASGAGAVAQLLRHSGPAWRVVGNLLLLPGISRLADVVYRLVADNRMRLPGGTAACALPPTRDVG